MKDYKEERIYIGDSDEGRLTLINADNEESYLSFGEDGRYTAYLVRNNDVSFPDCYKKVYECDSFLVIKDDKEITTVIEADSIQIFRAGLRGFIIRVCNLNNVEVFND